MARFRRRLLAVLIPLTIVAVLIAAAVLWLDQQSARARLAEAQLEPGNTTWAVEEIQLGGTHRSDCPPGW